MGHIEKRAQGRWRARYRDPQGRERSKTFRRKVDAERFLAEMEVARSRGTWTDPARTKTPFDEFARDVLASKIDVRGATLAKFETLLRVHVIAHFGSTAVGSITRADVQAFVNDLAARRAPATVAECYGILAGVLREAVEEGYISRTPARRIKLPRAERVEKRFLSPAELERLVASCPPRYRAVVGLTSGSAGRRSRG
ncbi:MAG: tyrosine-type recombinase/integrase [Actinomycetota bacterium]